MTVCVACRSTRTRVRARRRRTGGQIIECRDCGLRSLVHTRTADVLEASYDSDAEHVEDWMDGKRESVATDTWPTTLKRIAGLTRGRALFDVGAAEGSFLAEARKAGFEPLGNELSTGSIKLAKKHFDVTLEYGDLGDLLAKGERDEAGGVRAGQQDVVTMWCVLAHVGDTDRLLADAARLLKPGGVLFLQTPRWSGLDSIALAALELSRGRISRVVDRRTPGHHLQFHTTTSITQQLERHGFEVIEARARARYSINTAGYLSSLGIPGPLVRLLARPIDWLLERELFFRIVVDAYARKKPVEQAASAA